MPQPGISFGGLLSQEGGAGGSAGFESLLSGPWGLAAGFGLSAIGGLLGIRSKRRQLEELRRAMEESLQPVEAQLETRRTGLSQTEGRVAAGATAGTLRDLASRGVLESSFAPGEVGAAVAPLELRRQEDVAGLERGLASARQQIAALTSAPGYGQAFGNLLGETGEFLALRGGLEEGRKRSRRLLVENLDELLGG